MRTKYAVAISAAALLTVISGPSGAYTSGTCHSPTTYFQTSTDQGSTNSTTYSEVPDGTFGLRTTKPVCLEIDFAADTYIASGDAIEVEAVLDGKVMDPGYFIVDDGDWAYGRSWSIKWIVQNVPVGAHTIYIYWRTYAGSETAFMGAHTTTLTY